MLQAESLFYLERAAHGEPGTHPPPLKLALLVSHAVVDRGSCKTLCKIHDPPRIAADRWKAGDHLCRMAPVAILSLLGETDGKGRGWVTRCCLLEYV